MEKARVNLRLDVAEKELWVQAAGGERKLSQWIRDRCNATLTEPDQGGSASYQGEVPRDGRAALEVGPAPGSVNAARSFRPDFKPARKK